MNWMACKLYLNSMFTVAAFSVYASSATAENLEEAVARGLESNPEVRFQAKELDALREEVREARGGYLPSVDLDISVGQARRDYDDRGTYDRDYAELSVTQMLFDGYRVDGLVDEADYQLREQYFVLLEEAEEKALEMVTAYLDVQRYRQLKTLAEANVENHLQVLEQVKDRAGQGVGNRADLYQAEARLALAESNLNTEVSNLQSVTARYQRLVGHAPDKVLAPVTELGTLPDDLPTVLTQAYSRNPSLQSTLANIHAAESALQVAKAENYPTLDLEFSHGTYRNNNSFDSSEDDGDFGDETILQLRLQYNLFRGGSDRAAQRAAFHRIGRAETLRDKACVDLRQTTTIAWSELLNLRAKMETLQAHRESSNRVVQAYRDQFSIGRRSLLDVLDSENEVFQAERNVVQGQHDLLIAQAQLLNSMGQLLETLGLSDGGALTADDSIDLETQPLPSQYCSAVTEALVGLN